MLKKGSLSSIKDLKADKEKEFDRTFMSAIDDVFCQVFGEKIAKTLLLNLERRTELKRAMDAEEAKRLLVKETNDLLKRYKRERGEIRRNHMKMRGELLEALGIWRSTFGSKEGVPTPKISKEGKVGHLFLHLKTGEFFQLHLTESSLMKTMMENVTSQKLSSTQLVELGGEVKCFE